MEIIISLVADVCMGVRRSLDLVTEQIHAGVAPLYTSGPLIHNPGVLAHLAEQGVQHMSAKEVLARADISDNSNNSGALDNVDASDSQEKPQGVSPGTVVIRAHGVAPQDIETYRAAGYTVIDGTCPWVVRSQKKILSLRLNHFVVIIGDPNHPEVKGLAGCYTDGCVLSSYVEWECFFERVVTGQGLISDPRLRASDKMDPAKTNLSKTADSAYKSILLVAQSTCDPGLYQAIVKSAQSLPAATASGVRVSVMQSICKATTLRQDALRKLCKEVPVVVVIGGKKSANTCTLVDIAKHCGVKTYHIEGVAGIPNELYTYKKIGIALGASTPRDQLDAVVSALQGDVYEKAREAQP